MPNLDLIPTIGGVAPSGPSFRGEWAGAGELIYSQNFADSVLPSEFSITPGLKEPATNARMPMGSAIGSAATRPNYPYCWEVLGNSSIVSGNGISLNLDLAKITALQGRQITSVVSWWAAKGSNYFSSEYAQLKVDGTVVEQYGGAKSALQSDWRKSTFNGSASLLSWNITKGGDDGAGPAVTGIEVYAIDPDLTYNIGDTVSYQGAFYQSMADGNTSTPGADAQWKAISAASSVLPEGGATGQVLAVTEAGVAWAEVPFESGGPYQQYVDEQIAQVRSDLGLT